MVKATKKAAVVAKVTTKKAKARKAKAQVKKAEPAKCDFNFWKLASDIEDVSYKIINVKDVVELAAERVMDCPESGALWAITDMLEIQIQTMENLAAEVRDANRQYGKSPFGKSLSWEIE